MELRYWIALALALAAVWAAWLRVKKSKQIKAVAGWAEVRGGVTSHAIEETASTDSDGRSQDHYDPKIGYDYSYGGQSFSGTRIALDGLSFTSRKKAQAWLDARPVSSDLAVFVDPANPADALLTRKASAGWWVPIFFLGLAIVVALGLFGE